MSPERTVRRLVDIMARLRGPGGCPWDREQSHSTLRPYLIEEAYEVLEAIDAGDPHALREELGDLLLQVVFHAQIASERGEFGLAEVCAAVADKLERRHPHVFAEVTVRDSAEVLRNWARIKTSERERDGRESGVLAGVPSSLPALLYAHRIGEKAARVGFDWSTTADVLAKVREELGELEHAVAAGDAVAAGEELGDVLFALASVGRHLGRDAEQALRGALSRFVSRFRAMEHANAASGVPLHDRSPEELERLWNAAKQASARSASG
jgi:MazG family protein